jgi:predicted RNase H-like HicB family nuclease
MADYIAYLHKDKHSDYGVSFPDFPGAVTAGRTLQEAKKLAVEALALHIHGMIEDGEPIPEPSTLDDLQNDPALKNAVAFLVSAQPSDKTVRFNVTAREAQLIEITKRAMEAGLNRSSYMVQAALYGRVSSRPLTRRKPRARSEGEKVSA